MHDNYLARVREQQALDRLYDELRMTMLDLPADHEWRACVTEFAAALSPYVTLAAPSERAASLPQRRATDRPVLRAV